MKISNFGVIITCCNKDFWMTKACCASIKHFMPDVPICLLIDGDIYPRTLIKKYGVIILNKENIENDFLRENSFGYGVTKMNAFWESPFEKFLLIDADTIIWGDFSNYLNFIDKQFDLITEITNKNYTSKDISKWFFDTELMSKIDPYFKYNPNDFFSTGVLIGRKNIIDIELYKEILQMSKNFNSLFKYGEMGFFNYIIVKLKNKGRIKVGNLINHTNVCEFSIDELKEKYNVDNLRNHLHNIEPSIIHYVGNYKPFLNSKITYSEPFTYFRKQYLTDCYKSNLIANKYFLRLEEHSYTRPRIRKLIDKIMYN